MIQQPTLPWHAVARPRQHLQRLALVVAAPALVQMACSTTAQPMVSADHGDVVELYGSTELALRAGSRVHQDSAGRRYLVREEEDPRAGCALADAAAPDQVVGHFAVPTDAEGFDHCVYLGGSPGQDGASGWVLAGGVGTACAYRIDELLAAMQQKRAPACAVELPQAANPAGGAPEVVGWLSEQYVVVKTGYCCGSYKYHVVHLDGGHVVGLGMSFESRSPKQFPALRPWSAERSDYWIVQRAAEASAEWPSTIATVHCSQVLHYLDSGQGAYRELTVDGRRVPAGARLDIPDRSEPCPTGAELFAPGQVVTPTELGR
ncbi:MAG: hypothetical protein ABIJ09_09000 [Pseudomonadota bacterium]